MKKFIKDLFCYFFQKDRSQNKVSQMMTTLFKDYPAYFWEKPTFKKILMVPLFILYYIFSEGKKEKKPE